MPGSVSKTMSPPLPPSPPDGPPKGTNFSLRKATQPLPPRPATIRTSQLSTNLTRGSYHLIVGILRLLPFGFGLASLSLIGIACATNSGQCFADDLPDSNNQDANCDGVDGKRRDGDFRGDDRQRSRRRLDGQAAAIDHGRAGDGAEADVEDADHRRCRRLPRDQDAQLDRRRRHLRRVRPDEQMEPYVEQAHDDRRRRARDDGPRLQDRDRHRPHDDQRRGWRAAGRQLVRARRGRRRADDDRRQLRPSSGEGRLGRERRRRRGRQRRRNGHGRLATATSTIRARPASAARPAKTKTAPTRTAASAAKADPIRASAAAKVATVPAA